MTDAVIEEILSRDYISSTTCDRLAEVCLLRSQRTDGLEEFLFFQTLESLCKQASRYAKREEQVAEYAAAGCPSCGMKPAPDGVWHKPGCEQL